MHVFPWLPKGGETRKRFNPASGPRTKATGPHITAATGAKLQRDYAPVIYSDTTIKRLQLERDQRIQEALLALEVDRVMTDRQLKLYYGLRPADLPGALISSALIRPVHNRYGTEVKTTLIITNPSLGQLDDSDLNHLLVTAQIRYNRDIPANEHWQVSNQLSKFDKPDATYTREDGSIDAIEADTGNYKLTKVLKKIQVFQEAGYEEVHWGTISNTRINFLTQELPHEHTPLFHRACWWELPEPI